MKLYRCVGSCNTLNDLSNKVCIPNKTEDLNLSVFNIITEINESKTLTKYISCEHKSRFDGIKCNSYQLWNNDKCRCECKKRHVFEEDYVWNSVICSCENNKHLAGIMDNSAIICHEVIDADAEGKSNDEAKTNDIGTNFNEKKATCKTQKFYISLAFLIVTIELLIIVIIYCCLIKYRAKQLSSFHYTDNELRKVLY